ncbi:unannotated protein [freshwater metagenome]|jgi:photosystem II stability/assembly factor-like uncharacterized protein|uniref:Unannotated protein n=1 Tax=freshwater metagenome TaxID=449393 RepID=A0A6J7K370_9ZZZZ
MLGITVFAVTLTACGTTAGTSASTVQGPAASSGISVPSVGAAQPISGAELAGHIHNLAYDGRRLLIGTHEGLWGQVPGARPAQLSDDAFDVMGLTIAGDRWLASGHPGDGMDAPADLGLLQSTDRGRTWAEVSLGGEVDFHRLAASGAVVVGLNAHDGRLLRSDDGGTAWIDLGVPGLYDLAVSPADPAVIVGTSESGPVRSIDSGASFNAVGGAPLLALLAWTGGTLYGADVDGRIHESTDDGITWKPLGSLPSQPSALAATGATIAALVADTVLESVDGGASFTLRITGLGGH